MKSVTYICILIASLSLLISCGGAKNGQPGPAVFSGATLSMAEALQIQINQFFINGEWDKDESTFFDVYLKDSFYGEYIVCAGRDEGLDVASQRSVYYGKLSATMRRVDGVTTYESPEITIVVVADQEDPCPAKPDESKIVTTATTTFSDLLDAPIMLGDNEGYITFRGTLHDDVDVPDMPDIETGNLVVGELYFEDDIVTSGIPQYYLVLNFSDMPELDYIRRENMPDMKESRVVYSKLNLVFENVDESLLNEGAWVVLYRFGDAGPVEIGRTEAKPIKDLIGHKFDFTNGRGYIKFRELSN